MSHQSDLISQDILGYLKQHEQKDLLRFLTCGNVDDGKSTLIGRLLYDSKLIYEDQLQAVTRDSKKVGTTGDAPDLALLVDGLQAEREQGITIDVAYRYFSTEKRKFIIADTPGHVQYTRNMFTGASNTELAIILVDARHGITEQTRRHSIISSIVGLPHILVCINKMDLVDYKEDVYNQIVEEYKHFSEKLGFNKREAREFIDAFCESIIYELAEGRDVKISGFGNFETRDKPSRPGRNPRSGQSVLISPKRVLVFKASGKLKARINKD
jgi:sulfate adenylyltransferase subunit 1